MLPCWVSLALPLNDTEAPCTTFDPFVGLTMVTTGAVLTGGGWTIERLIECASLNPPWSVTLAVITCAPTLRLPVENDEPVPICPSRLEVQTIEALRLPLSGSVALPEKVIDVPLVNEALFDGLLIDSVGAVLVGA